MPRELARKRPANVTTLPAADDGRTIDGRYRAVRGGPTLGGALTAFVLILLAVFFAGFLLSSV